MPASDYPLPLIVPPLSTPHKQTFILLHGRGSSGEKFGPPLLNTPISQASASTTSVEAADTLTLASAFPHARFVFPTAARRRATLYRRAHTNQWFDNWELDPPATDREELQIPGLRETVSYLHDLLRAEIDLVPGGAENVILGGLSQGCAASLIALLLWEGDPIGGAIGMCGWLPFRQSLEDEVADDAVTGSELGTGEDFDPFSREDDDDGAQDGVEHDAVSRAIHWLRDELGLTAASRKAPLTYQSIPLFLGHGVQDDRVSVILGKEASSCLKLFKMQTSWNEYEDLGHWYSADMLRDMVNFLRTRLN